MQCWLLHSFYLFYFFLAMDQQLTATSAASPSCTNLSSVYDVNTINIKCALSCIHCSYWTSILVLRWAANRCKNAASTGGKKKKKPPSLAQFWKIPRTRNKKSILCGLTHIDHFNTSKSNSNSKGNSTSNSNSKANADYKSNSKGNSNSNSSSNSKKV